ncbi:MAG: GMC family oxidoreductase N-terminal domain-containing protein, partial [Rhizobiaceae bacterium]
MHTFDFIIVGAGSSGCVLAERLSVSGRHSVLVLEAGGTDLRFFVQMPLGYGKMFFDRSVNWMYKAEPDPGLAGNADHWPRGKVMGGSSSINAMVWIRGAKEDYDEWEALGNKGWGWADMLPVFKRLEDYAGGANEWRGAGGPVHVSRIDGEIHPLTKNFIDATTQTGLPSNDDFNGERQEGVGLYQINTKGGRRMSASRAFLRPAMKRSNVTVLTGAHVTRILFDGKRAIGVE